jgi:hypothetical protein
MGRGILRPACLPRCSEGPGESSGEVCEVEVVGWRGDGSPEFARQMVRSSRGWFHRSRPWEVRKTCQGKARKESKQVGTREESR